MTVAYQNFYKYVNHGKDAELSPVFITLSDEEVFDDVNSWTNNTTVVETQKLISYLQVSDNYMLIYSMFANKH
jgi:hypothetical protein